MPSFVLTEVSTDALRRAIPEFAETVAVIYQNSSIGWMLTIGDNMLVDVNGGGQHQRQKQYTVPTACLRAAVARVDAATTLVSDADGVLVVGGVRCEAEQLNAGVNVTESTRETVTLSDTVELTDAPMPDAAPGIRVLSPQSSVLSPSKAKRILDAALLMSSINHGAPHVTQVDGEHIIACNSALHFRVRVVGLNRIVITQVAGFRGRDCIPTNPLPISPVEWNQYMLTLNIWRESA